MKYDSLIEGMTSQVYVNYLIVDLKDLIVNTFFFQ